MSEELPGLFDVVVVGTGLAESIVGAACARIGKSVLHLDGNKFYGSIFASFTLLDFQAFIESNQSPSNNEVTIADDGIQANLQFSNINFASFEWGDGSGDTSVLSHNGALDETAIELSQGELIKKSHKFNIELTPKVLYCKSKTLDLLIQSDVSQYVEFLMIKSLLTTSDNQEIIKVPFTRADMFNCQHINLKQKRLLFGFFQWSLIADIDSLPDESFCQLLENRGFDSLCQNFILVALAMESPTVSAKDGVKKLQKLLHSLTTRYGSYPFMYPLYGSGDLPQGFCRSSAVFGGVCCLDRTVTNLLTQDNTCNKIRLSTGQTISVKEHFIIHSHYLPNVVINQDSIKYIARGIYLTNKHIYQDPIEDNDIVCFPYKYSLVNDPAIIIELSSKVQVCPKDTFLVHISASIDRLTDPKEVLKPISDFLFQSNDEVQKPKVLWNSHFLLPDYSLNNNTNYPSNIHILSSPNGKTIDFDSVISEAEAVFQRLYPDADFFPHVEVVHNGNENNID